MRSEAQLLDAADQAIRAATKAGASAADCMVLDSADLTASVRLGENETIERAESCGLGLRVFVGQASATLSSSDLSPETLADMAARAVAIARVAPADPFAGLAHQDLLARSIPALDIADRAEPSIEELQNLARQCEEAGRAVAGITNSEGADASTSLFSAALATSHGFSGTYSASRHSLSLSLIAGSGADMERDYDYAVRTHHADLPAPARIGQRAAELTLARLKPRKIASQTAPVFFDPRVGKSLLSAFANAIHGSAVARGTSFLKGALHTQVFSPAITITDDPLRPRGLGSHPFDGEGVRVAKRHFIERGMLTSWMMDVRSANQLGLATTGHAVRSLSGTPHPSSTNLYLEPGALSVRDLLASVPSGFYVTETIGHGTNLITGDYSVGASGFWIERGERAYPVSEVTIAGNLKDIFAHVVAADDLIFHYGTNAPTLLVPSMTIAGQS